MSGNHVVFVGAHADFRVCAARPRPHGAREPSAGRDWQGNEEGTKATK